MHLQKAIKFECIDLEVSQQFSPKWQTESVYGKMDPLANFTHTERTAKVKMVLFGKNVEQAKHLQQNVDQLLKYQYPKYKGGDGGAVLQSPPFFQVKVLQNKLYSQMKGFFTDLTVTPGSQEEVVPLVDNSNLFYERKYTIDFSMTLLHSGVVGWMGAMGPGGADPFIFTAQTDPGAEAGKAMTKQVMDFVGGLGDKMKSGIKSALNISRSTRAEVKSKFNKTKVPIQDK